MQRTPHKPSARDAGVARLRRATRVVVFGATALAGAFAGLAAQSAPGHKSHAVAVRTTTRTVRTTTQAATTAQAPAATSSDDTTPATTAAPPPPPPPVTTTIAPVATTGGT